jgi:SNF2 family DNA or RNA helicase
LTTVEKSKTNLEKQMKLAADIKNGQYPADFKIPGWTEEYSPFTYQMQGILWMYLTPKAILADSTGLGKSLQCLALLTLLKAKGRVSPQNRAIIIVPATSVYSSWKSDGFDKFKVPLDYAIGRGTKAQRQAVYEDSTWEVLLTNYETVRNDIDVLEGLGFKHVIMDEVDYIKNHTTQTAKAVKRLTLDAHRVVAVSATPIQNSLLDLHSILEALGLKKVFGSKTAFDRRYHEHVVEQIRTRSRTIYKKKVVGYKNTVELKKKLEPYFIRRTYNDVDVKIPELQSQQKFVELTPEQRQMYEDVKRGFAKLKPNSPPKEIKAAALKLRQVCTGTASAGASFDSSGKFDWLMDTLQADWSEDKVVMFSNWKDSIRAFEKRLDAAGIGYVTLTGDETSQEVREKKRQQFWGDPNCRVLMGTTAIEKSLNLQCANIQVNLDMLYNPARHQQLAGRVHRVGSIHDEAWVFSILTKDTIEEHVMKLLQRKQAISDHVFDDTSTVFEQLSPNELYQLIKG